MVLAQGLIEPRCGAYSVLADGGNTPSKHVDREWICAPILCLSGAALPVVLVFY